MPRYGMVYYCQQEDFPYDHVCGWSTTNYSEIDAHEDQPRHFVIGQMERLND